MEKISIIDDSVSNALLIKGYLKPLAVDSAIFLDPTEALTWCREHEPTLVLLDFLMPGMNGTEFISRFRSDCRMRDVPVIVVTWDERKETMHQALKAGATDFLHKPIDRVELIIRTKNLLELQLRRRDFAEAEARTARLNAELNDKIKQLEAAYDLMAGRQMRGRFAA